VKRSLHLSVSYVCHASLFDTCALSHVTRVNEPSHVCHDSFTRVCHESLTRVCHDSFTRVCHDSFTRVKHVKRHTYQRERHGTYLKQMGGLKGWRHIERNHATRENASWRTYSKEVHHVGKSHVTSVNESCHKCE